MNAKDQWISEIENSLNGIKPAEVSPYLYSKIINRLESKFSNYAPAKLVWVTAASMIILIILNFTTLTKAETTYKSRNADIARLADQYQLSNNSLINYN